MRCEDQIKRAFQKVYRLINDLHVPANEETMKEIREGLNELSVYVQAITDVLVDILSKGGAQG